MLEMLNRAKQAKRFVANLSTEQKNIALTNMAQALIENTENILRLEDIICAILEEYTWCVPVHLPAERLNSPCHIDLFAAETGLYLAEIKYLLYDNLSPLVVERITTELDRRIVRSFKNNKFVFEEYKP